MLNMKRWYFLVILLIICFFNASLQSFAQEKNFQPGHKVKVMWRGTWHVCIVLERGEGKFKVHFEDDERIFDKWVKSEIVENYTYKVGDIILVKKDNRWLAGRVLAVSTLQYKIHYEELESIYDEWVGPDRIKDLSYREGERVKVFWNGDWFEAKILRYKDGRYLVHFEGFPDSNDMWVTIDKIKKWGQK